MLPGIWYYAASPIASLVVAGLMLWFLCRRKYHRLPNGKLSRQRLGAVVVLSASTYTFAVGVLSELVFHGPSLSAIIHDGFGDSRVAWLLLGVVIDASIRLWDEYHPAA